MRVHLNVAFDCVCVGGGSGCHRECYCSDVPTFFRSLFKIITWREMLNANCIEISVSIHKMDKIQNKSLL